MQNFFILVISFFTLIPGKPEIHTFRIFGYAQGTSYQITYYAEDRLISKTQTDSILLRIDSSLSIYKPYSLISRFNNSERELEADNHLYAVVRKALEIFKETEGVFDITVKSLVEAWGSGKETISALPDSNRIKDLLNCVGSDMVSFDKMTVIKKRPCLQIDINGIAQGYTVDVLADFLEKKGIENYMVELGGEIRVKGEKLPQGGPMLIGIESPSAQPDQSAVQKIIQISHGAITTSGNYRKNSHLIDSKTGYPVRNELIGVTVWAKDAMTADGYDNALMNMGLKKAIQFAEEHKEIEAHFIYRKDNLIADTATAGFYKIMKQ